MWKISQRKILQRISVVKKNFKPLSNSYPNTNHIVEFTVVEFISYPNSSSNFPVQFSAVQFTGHHKKIF